MDYIDVQLVNSSGLKAGIVAVNPATVLYLENDPKNEHCCFVVFSESHRIRISGNRNYVRSEFAKAMQGHGISILG